VRPCQGRSRGFNSRLPLHGFFSRLPHAYKTCYALRANTNGHSRSGRGTQVVRERSAKPLCVGSIPTRASKVQSLTDEAEKTGCRLAAKWLPNGLEPAFSSSAERAESLHARTLICFNRNRKVTSETQWRLVIRLAERSDDVFASRSYFFLAPADTSSFSKPLIRVRSEFSSSNAGSPPRPPLVTRIIPARSMTTTCGMFRISLWLRPR
jgi:hypothetical protein